MLDRIIFFLKIEVCSLRVVDPECLLDDQVVAQKQAPISS